MADKQPISKWRIKMSTGSTFFVKARDRAGAVRAAQPHAISGATIVEIKQAGVKQ